MLIVKDMRKVVHLPPLREVLVGIIEVKVAYFTPFGLELPPFAAGYFFYCYWEAFYAFLAVQSLHHHSPLGATLRPTHL